MMVFSGIEEAGFFSRFSNPKTITVDVEISKKNSLNFELACLYNSLHRWKVKLNLQASDFYTQKIWNSTLDLWALGLVERNLIKIASKSHSVIKSEGIKSNKVLRYGTSMTALVSVDGIPLLDVIPDLKQLISILFAAPQFKERRTEFCTFSNIVSIFFSATLKIKACVFADNVTFTEKWPIYRRVGLQ